MPWLTQKNVFEYFTADCRKSDARPLLSVVLDGTSFDLFRSVEVSHDFVVRVENDPSLEVYRALNGALQVLGVDGSVYPLVLSAEDRKAIFAGDVQGESRGYAVIARELGHDRSVSRQAGRGVEGLGQTGNDVGFGAQFVAVAADEQSGMGHGSSPELECGDSVRDAFSPVGWAKLTLRPPVRRYQQLPVQVEAVQWTGNNLGDLMVFVADTNIAKRGDRFCIEPPDAEATFAVPGDYVVRDAAGTYRCIPATAFKSSYAVVVTL